MRVEEEDHFSNPAKGFDPHEVKRRIEEQNKRKEDKLEKLRREKEAKELEACTFAPQLASKKVPNSNKQKQNGEHQPS